MTAVAALSCPHDLPPQLNSQTPSARALQCVLFYASQVNHVFFKALSANLTDFDSALHIRKGPRWQINAIIAGDQEQRRGGTTRARTQQKDSEHLLSAQL